jgi:hypothetical protein
VEGSDIPLAILLDMPISPTYSSCCHVLVRIVFASGCDILDMYKQVVLQWLNECVRGCVPAPVSSLI